MGLIGWLVTIGCLLIGSAIGVWGFTEVNKIVPIWVLGLPGCALIVLGAAFELQEYANAVEAASVAAAKQVNNPVVPDPVFAKKGAAIVITYPNQIPVYDETDQYVRSFNFKTVLTNEGDTTAVVTKVVMHVYLAEHEPDPYSVHGIRSKEDMGTKKFGGPFSPFSFSNTFIIAPGKSVESINYGVGFYGTRIKELNGEFPHKFLSHIWFLCVVTYDDVYGKGRETSFYAQLSGTGTLAVEHQQYNYMK